MLQKSITEFTELLASPAAVPGGGGASALVGAIGIALGDMVGELTVGKKKYADVEEEIRALMEKAQDLRVRLLACITKDAEAFEPLSRAYGIPKDAPGRDETLEKCLHEAARAPMEIFDLCCEAIDLLEVFGEKGSKLVISDAATGAAIAKGALYGAAVNVKVNTRLMKDREFAAQMNEHIDIRMDIYSEKADQIFDSIYERFAN